MRHNGDATQDSVSPTALSHTRSKLVSKVINSSLHALLGVCLLGLVELEGRSLVAQELSIHLKIRARGQRAFWPARVVVILHHRHSFSQTCF